MNRLSFIAIALTLAVVTAVQADDARSTRYTFTKDVQPILQNNCQDCHRPDGKNFSGMIAPMPLTSFEETRPWAKSIAQHVSSGEMPPWDAHPDFNGIFSNERTLSDIEIAAIVGWANQGAPRGNPGDAPPERVFEATNGGWLNGTPDLIVTIPEAYQVTDDAYDIYTAFAVDLTDEMLPEDVYVQGFQCKPGVKVIHHFNAHLLPPDGEGKLPPPPSHAESGAISPQGAGFYIGGIASGSEANVYPLGYGLPLKKGTRVTFDIHYHKEPGPGTGVIDSKSQIGFYFTKEPPKSPVSGTSMMRFDIDIDPGEAEYKMGPVSSKIRSDSEIVALMPHMHTRGKRAKFEAFYPDGTSEVLIEVPKYDFAWQTVYYFKDMKPLPKGSRLEFTAWFDNSEEYSALRGFDPTQRVNFGQKSSDEMMMGFVVLAPVVD